MPEDCLSYSKTNYFSSLIIDYLDQKNELKPFYHRFPSIENFEAQMEEKKNFFSSEKRALLVNVLKDQYKDLEKVEAVASNIDLLLEDDTFTVTTGH
ncbi:MAG TPA: bacillithiol biosynthesis BshC, partial [Gillisia sp.]|nr:bacillithiol biosynthesis BshC [Gillisia sp.]